jgi:hypothetical protein
MRSMETSPRHELGLDQWDTFPRTFCDVSHHCFRFAFGRQRHVSSWKQAPGVRSQPPMEHSLRFKVAGSVSAFISSLPSCPQTPIDVADLFSLVHAARTHLLTAITSSIPQPGTKYPIRPRFLTAKPSPFC